MKLATFLNPASDKRAALLLGLIALCGSLSSLLAGKPLINVALGASISLCLATGLYLSRRWALLVNLLFALLGLIATPGFLMFNGAVSTAYYVNVAVSAVFNLALTIYCYLRLKHPISPPQAALDNSQQPSKP